MKIPHCLFILPIALALTSCAFQAPLVATATQPDKHTAILYGKFDVNHDFVYENQLGLWLQNLDSEKSIYIFFDPAQPLKAVRAEPGRYRLAGIVGINRSHQVNARKLIPAGQMPPPFTVPEGSEVYLGDYTGSVTYDGFVATWGLTRLKDRFDITTVEFREKYPNLRGIPAVSIFHRRTIGN